MNEISKLMRRLNKLMDKTKTERYLELDNRTNEVMVLTFNRFKPEMVGEFIEQMENTEKNLTEQMKNMKSNMESIEKNLKANAERLGELKPYWEKVKHLVKKEESKYIG